VRSVLVVDDSKFARTITIRRIRERGMEATSAGSCQEAAAVDPRHITAALLDMDLGDGFGTEVAERLRDAVAELPVAFLTARVTEERRTEAVKFGPIFSKADGLDAAIDWLFAAIRSQRAALVS
jgi:CheY-like chemotaxis protein